MDLLITGSEYIKRHPDFKLVGRDAELERLSAILMRSSANSVILVGPGGVGCTALCLGVQASKELSDTPFDIVAKRLFWLDTDALFATGNANTINEAFQRVMAVMKRTPESILLIEDTRDFIEAARNNGVSHFINAITSSIKNGYMQVIFEVRDEDYETVLKWHSDLREGFTVLDINEPTGEALKMIIEKNVGGLTAFHGIKFDEESITTAIELTNKYRTRDPGLSRAQPERSVTLLDRTVASYRLEAHRLVSEEVSKKLKNLFRNQREGELAIIEIEEEIVRVSAEKPAKDGFESPEVVELRRRMDQYQKMVDENREEFEKQTDEVNAALMVTRDLVLKEFAKISGISASKLSEDEREKLINLEKYLLGRIFGQDEAVSRLANAVKVARAVRRNKDKPQASFMLLGPSGVGKTEIAKALAAALLDDEKALTRFDMSEYMEKHAVAKLIGAPPGYEGFEAGGILTNAMRKNPYRIILFDEIEKAHPDVFNVFLQILDDARLTDNLGRTVSFTDSIIIMTTNTGQPHFLNKEITFETAKELALEDLASTYRSEFLNRFSGRQNIVCFNKLEVHHIEKIVSREIVKLAASYLESKIEVVVADDAVQKFCRDHYDPIIGARGLPGFIAAHLEPILADLALEGYVGKASVTYNEIIKNFEVKKDV